jgi:hypothetical protein
MTDGGSFQVSIHDIIEEVFPEPCTYSYICTPRVCLESCVHAEETLHIRGLPQNCHITQQNTLFIGCAGVIVIFEGPRAWKQWLRRLNVEIYWQEMKYWKHSEGHNFWPIRREMGKTNHPNTTAVPGCVYLFCLKTYWFAARPVKICAIICVYLYSQWRITQWGCSSCGDLGITSENSEVLPTLNCQLKHSCTIINRAVESVSCVASKWTLCVSRGYVKAHEDSVMVFTLLVDCYLSVWKERERTIGLKTRIQEVLTSNLG